MAQWRDRSPAAHHAAQTDATMRPVRVTSPAGLPAGLAAVRFDGTNDNLTGSNNVSPGPMTIAFVARDNGSGSDVHGVWTSAYAGVFARNGAYIIDFNGSGAGNSANTTSNIQTWRTITAQYKQADNTGLSIWLDGTLEELVPSGSGAPTGAGFFIGARDNASRVFRGEIAELVVVGGTVSLADRQRIEGYLAHRWGLAANLPAGHPHKAAPPTQ